MAVGVVALEYGGRETRVIRGIGKMLRLEAKRRPFAVDLSAFAANAAVQEVAGIELNAGLGGTHFHDPATLRLAHAGGQRGEDTKNTQQGEDTKAAIRERGHDHR